MEAPPEYSLYPVQPPTPNSPSYYQHSSPLSTKPQSETSQYVPPQATAPPYHPSPMLHPGYTTAPQPNMGFGIVSPSHQAGYSMTPTYPVQTIMGQSSPQMTSRTVVQQPGIIFGRHPTQCFCPNCHLNVVTTTTTQPGSFTWFMCILLCFFIGFFSLILFCIPECQDVRHTCPNCQHEIRVYEKM